MTDERFTELANQYLDREISTSEFEELMREVQRCPARKAKFQQLCQLQVAMQHLVRRQDRQELEVSPLVATSRAFRHQMSAVAAGLIIAILVAFQWYSQLQFSPEPSFSTTSAGSAQAQVQEPSHLQIAHSVAEPTVFELSLADELEEQWKSRQRAKEPVEMYPFVGNGFEFSRQSVSSDGFTTTLAFQ